MNNFRFDLPDRYNASAILFDNLEAGRGSKIAIRCGDATVSYGDLCDDAARVGNGLRDLGVSAGSRVLLLLLDTPRFPAAFFGAMRAGYVPIPTNTVLHPDDYAFFLRDSEASTVIVDADLAGDIIQVRGDCPHLQHVIVAGGDSVPAAIDWDAWTGSASKQLDPAPTKPDDQAFWLYSSGSTGFPKGVVHVHRSIPYTVETFAKRVLEMGESDVTFSASKAFHAYGLGNNVTFPYGVGASTVLFPGRPAPDAIFEQIARFRPTLFFAAPTLYAAMLLAAEHNELRELGSVRLCVSAAEALPPDIYDRWLDRFGVEILDGLGSTEMLHIFISNRPGQALAGSSGTVVPGYEAKIVDEKGAIVAAEVAGDLVVRGGSRADSYWRRPDRTAHAMRGDWLFTGDRYYQDNEGYFHYEGRSDDMFKVGGQWVSPIEVENALAEHAAILECAVVPYTDEAQLTRAKAFVVLNDNVQASPELVTELQAHVKATIAPYKYPRVVEFVRELPKTATGKIQRFKLREEGVS